MEHEEQKDPVAQSTSAHSTTSAVDLSDRDNKETLVVKEEVVIFLSLYNGVHH